ncbi:hypothetical protein IQ268_15920 [Oculatella sp. LEGE 06141]|uniref:hypothetical protein n=1 Tax=Oculatella sp. LEGE 06141 TaxID=1828648 RepID=UPI001880E696|nr:hypothetical protein [Oculatella sp. LEGE 06141]MBE9180058.1 hypothetical protein [Oculatella sp. LEGE 06141]
MPPNPLTGGRPASPRPPPKELMVSLGKSLRIGFGSGVYWGDRGISVYGRPEKGAIAVVQKKANLLAR